MILNGDDANTIFNAVRAIEDMTLVDSLNWKQDHHHQVNRLAHVLRRFFSGDAEIGAVKAVYDDVVKKYSNTFGGA